MGFKQDNIIRHRPTIAKLSRMNGEALEMVRYTIEEYVIPNPTLRRRSVIGWRKREVGKLEMTLPTFSHYKPLKNSLWSFSWGILIQVREAIEKQDMGKALELVYGVAESSIAKMDVFHVFAAYKWVVEQVKAITQAEKDAFGTEPDQELKDAGIDRLTPFGVTVSVDDLARGDILKHKEIMSKPYMVIFKKMCLDHVRNDIKRQLQENASRKAGRNS